MELVPGLLFLFVIALVIGLVWFVYVAKKRRREGIARMAASLGMEYSREDPFDFLSLPFQLFGKGDGRGVENVMWGNWNGLELKEFDYWYYEESSGANGGRSRSYYRFSCALTELPLDAARITIVPETFLTRMADHLGFADIQFESEEFNRKFRVKCDDSKFATDLVDARMMQWLMKGARWSFELSGPYLLCYCGRARPTELIPVLGEMKAFRDHIPRVVHELYGVPGGKVEPTEERTSS